MERVGRNLIRGTAKLTFVDSNSNWDDGTWRYRNTADGDSVSVIEINDSSIPNIKYGIRINRVNNPDNATYIDIFQNGIELMPNSVYTMSAWVRGAGMYAFWANVTFVDDRYHNISEGDKDKWIHISSKIQTNDSVISQFMIGSNVSVEMCGFKLEKGDTATAWTPAPEDQFGRNLLTRNDCKNSTYYSVGGWSITLPKSNNSTTLTFSSNNIWPSGKYKVGDVYTISFLARASGETKLYCDFYPDSFDPNGGFGGKFDQTNFDVGTEEKQYSLSDKLVFKGSGDPTQMYFRLWRLYIHNNEEITIRNIKIERGTIDTPWTPAPEDSPSYAQSYIMQPIRSIQKSMKKAVVTLDHAEYTYNSQEHAPKVTKVMLDDVELRENEDYVYQSQPATAAGTYNVIVFGIGRYKDAIMAPWTINKAQGSITVTPSNVVIAGLKGSTTTAELKIVGDGNITFGQSDYVTCKRDGNTVTITSVAEGSGSVDIIMADGANYKGTKATLNFEVVIADPIFENNTWETIANVSASGHASDIWSLGDTKNITVDVDATYVRIIDFNHDDLDPTDAKYDDSSYNKGTKKAGITLCMRYISWGESAVFDKSSGVWETSSLRLTTLPEIKTKLETDGPGMYIRTVTKKTYMNDDDVYTTADEIFVESSIEYYTYYDNELIREGEGYRYEYYKNNPGHHSDGEDYIDGWSRTKDPTPFYSQEYYEYYDMVLLNSSGRSNSIGTYPHDSKANFYPVFCI